ncbi:hypothetical protein Trydic_g22559 [Trypoxylus dichotomus]
MRKMPTPNQTIVEEVADYDASETTSCLKTDLFEDAASLLTKLLKYRSLPEAGLLLASHLQYVLAIFTNNVKTPSTNAIDAHRVLERKPLNNEEDGTGGVHPRTPPGYNADRRNSSLSQQPTLTSALPSVPNRQRRRPRRGHRLRIYTSDIPATALVNLAMYVDDVCIFERFRDAQIIDRSLQTSLDTLQAWYAK